MSAAPLAMIGYGLAETGLWAVAVVLRAGSVVKLALVSPLTKPAYDSSEGRYGRAVNLGTAERGNRQWRSGDVKGAGNVGDRIVAIDRAAGGDAVRVARDMAAGRGGGGERRQSGQTGRRVAIDETRVAGRQSRNAAPYNLL